MLTKRLRPTYGLGLALIVLLVTADAWRHPARWAGLLDAFAGPREGRNPVGRKAKGDKGRAAWERIEALGGHGVWDNDMVVVVLAGTAVTDADLSVFRLVPVEILDLSRTAIGDAGLAQLSGLPSLEELAVVDTRITAAALETFRRDNPTVDVVTEPPPKGAVNPFTGKPL